MVPFQKVIVLYDPRDPMGKTRQFIPASWPESSVDGTICSLMELEHRNVQTAADAEAWMNCIKIRLEDLLKHFCVSVVFDKINWTDKNIDMLQPPHYGPETYEHLRRNGFFGTHWHWNGEPVFKEWDLLAMTVLDAAQKAAELKRANR